jgi:hypothetical protein
VDGAKASKAAVQTGRCRVPPRIPKSNHPLRPRSLQRTGHLHVGPTTAAVEAGTARGINEGTLDTAAAASLRSPKYAAAPIKPYRPITEPLAVVTNRAHRSLWSPSPALQRKPLLRLECRFCFYFHRCDLAFCRVNKSLDRSIAPGKNHDDVSPLPSHPNRPPLPSPEL